MDKNITLVRNKKRKNCQYGIIFSDETNIEWYETEQIRNEKALEYEEKFNYELN